mmetsp:Transcript_39955/g.127801  ORF Transcript_39955/g.127801 Transcript_39955/m.127801 type:complete len:206 (-) Transcript_39955:65-682(-)
MDMDTLSSTSPPCRRRRADRGVRPCLRRYERWMTPAALSRCSRAGLVPCWACLPFQYAWTVVAALFSLSLSQASMSRAGRSLRRAYSCSHLCSLCCLAFRPASILRHLSSISCLSFASFRTLCPRKFDCSFTAAASFSRNSRLALAPRLLACVNDAPLSLDPRSRGMLLGRPIIHHPSGRRRGRFARGSGRPTSLVALLAWGREE